MSKIECSACRGHGIISGGNPYDPSPEECRECEGNGHVWLYPSGVLAKWKGGPLIGRLPNKEASRA